jgi:hypothetical protein
MNQFVKLRKRLFQVMGWCFVATLFCDGANFDDLISGSIVLHEDDEVYATDLRACEGTNFPMSWEQQSSGGASAVRQSIPLSRTTVRIIIDQDSPSPPGGHIHLAYELFPFFTDSSAISFDNDIPTELLYLQFRSLLI